MAVIESSCNAASNSFLEQTEWAQRWRLETSLVGFGLMEPDRGDRVSSATTLAAMGDIFLGGAGFLWDQSRWWRAAVAFASGEREGASGCCMVTFLLLSVLAVPSTCAAINCDKLQPLRYDFSVLAYDLCPYKLFFQLRAGAPCLLVCYYR